MAELKVIRGGKSEEELDEKARKLAREIIISVPQIFLVAILYCLRFIDDPFYESFYIVIIQNIFVPLAIVNAVLGNMFIKKGYLISAAVFWITAAAYVYLYFHPAFPS